MKKTTRIDTNKMTRKIRDKQSKKYYRNTEKLLKDLNKLDSPEKKTLQSRA